MRRTRRCGGTTARDASLALLVIRGQSLDLLCCWGCCLILLDVRTLYWVLHLRRLCLWQLDPSGLHVRRLYLSDGCRHRR